jgi:transcriptional regulator with XRE-family HTH domain
MTNRPLKQLREELLTNPDVRAAYEEQAFEYAIARAVIAARARAGLNQTELATRMETSQPFVARLESGRTLPSMRTLLKVAEATGTEPRFDFKPKRKDKDEMRAAPRAVTAA